MEINEIIALSADFIKLREKVISTKTNTENIANYLKQYDPYCHVITDKSKRPDKVVTTGEGAEQKTKVVSISRLPIPMQKQIVQFAAAFLCGNPIELIALPKDDTEKDMMEVVKKSWMKNKLDYDSKKLVKIMMSETEVAELWYREEADTDYWANTPNEGRPHRLRMKVLANSLGDTLYPVFNAAGDMVAFARAYTLLFDGKKEEHFDVYTDKTTWLAKSVNGQWEVVSEANIFGKIPVIYYNQPKPEWNDVQALIERWEEAISNHADTNGYFSSPMVKVSGEIKGFATKGETGQVLELANGATADYMSWDQSPKSLELEFKNLRSIIYDMTCTPDISIENMKGLGTFSGIALKMLFLSAHLKAADKEETFGKSIQRRINFIINAMGLFNVAKLGKATAIDITPKFVYYMPQNEEEIINLLVAATGGKAVMTQATAVKHNPLVNDKEAEIEELKKEDTIDVLTP